MYVEMEVKKREATGVLKDILDGMTNEDIRNARLQLAADEYIGHPAEVDECSTTYGKREAFKAGAVWERNHVWHDTDKELPEEHRNVLATTASPKGRGIMEGGVTMVVDRGLLEADKKGMFKKWAYLSDLLPTDIEL